MAVQQKRKAVAKSAGQLFGGKRARAAAQKRVKQEKEEEECAQEQEEVDEEKDDGCEEEADAEEQEEESREDKLAREEEEISASRKKELKAMPVSDLKELATSKGLEAGKKDDIVAALLTHESEVRAAARAQQARIREVLVKKKDDLEALSAPELKELCSAAGAKGNMKKEERIALLLKQWQDDDGVDKAIAKMARDAREVALASMDEAALRQLCERSGVDAFVKEVVVDRVVRRERAAGRFEKPRPEGQEEEQQQQASKKGKAGTPDDVVDALLANEASRKREREQKKQAEDAAASKRKELRGMSIEELKKRLTSKGKEPTGKKEDLVEALFAVGVQEDAEAAKKAKLKALSPEELKQRLAGRGLQASGKKDAMVEALLGHEAELRKAAEAWEFKVGEELTKKRAELEEKTAAELKELCSDGGLKLGAGKQERVEVLLEAAQASGELDKVVAAAAKDARRDELLAMDRAAILEIGEAAGVDLLVKEVMVERIMLHEDEFGATAGDEEEEAKRPAKRPRKGGKK